MATSILKDTLYLENISADHYKFYEMKDNGDNTWTARYGKIGSKGSIKTYPIFPKWTDMYSEKLSKGYKLIKRTPNLPPKAKLDVNKKQLTIINKLILVLSNSGSGLPKPDSSWLSALRNYKTHLQNTGELTAQQMIHMNTIYKELKKSIPDLELKEK